MSRILVAGGAAAGVVLALVGCGGSITSPPNGAGTGIVLTSPPPFAIYPAPSSATYETCDSLSQPLPIGFLADGRAVVGQYVRLPYSRATLVRAWDPRTNTLERLFVASASPYNSSDNMLRIDRGGRRIFDVRFEQFQVYDVDRRGFLTGEAIPVTVRAVSDGGDFVLDGDLRRYTATGELDFDFKPLLPAEVHFPFPQLPLALSFAGDAIAVEGWEAPGGTPVPVVLVVHQDGRVVRLPDAPDISACDGRSCGMSWSADGRHLLLYADSLRVWEVATGQLIARLDGVSSAAFSADGAHVVTGDGEGNLIERDLSGVATFTWPIHGDPRMVGAQGKAFGADSSGLVVATRDRIEGSWLQPSYGWAGALALTSDAMFAIVFDWEPPVGSSGFHLMLARFAVDRPGPTAVFRPDESQSEWLGQVALSPDQQRVAVVFPDTVRILDAATLAPLATIPAGAGMIAWSPDGRYLAATPDLHYRDPGRTAYVPAREVTVWNASGTLAARFPSPVYPNAIAFDEGGGTLAGWGQPMLTDKADGSPAFEPAPGTLHIFVLDGDAAGFAIDLATSTLSPSNLPPFVGATRELVATEDSIVALSLGATFSAISGPVIGRGVFSSDFSVLLAVERAEQTEDRGIRLVSVATGETIAGIPMLAGNPDRAALAVSRGGRRVVADGHVACAR